MKYWRGYLVAAIFAAISWGLVQFAKAHTVLVDMIYPYMTRIIVSSLADWSSGVSFCLWQVIVLALVVALIVSIILMIVLRWNPIQWLGWILAAVCGLNMLNTVLYGLNDYTGPFAEDVRLEVTDYTVSELNEATIYFRDKANEFALQASRDAKGNPKFAKFNTLAKQAGEGFEVLTYDEAISVFAGSTAPVKELGWSSTYTARGMASTTMPLTGEAAVNPDTPVIALPFTMCKEMARRMSISNEEDAKFAAFLACRANPSADFQYSAYCLAYYYCYNALNSIPTSTAKSCAAQTDKGVNQLLRNDIKDYEEFFDKPEAYNKDTTDVADLLASWYIQEFITPLHKEEEKPFNPLDSTQVDLTYVEPTPTPLPKKDD